MVVVIIPAVKIAANDERASRRLSSFSLLLEVDCNCNCVEVRGAVVVVKDGVKADAEPSNSNWIRVENLMRLMVGGANGMYNWILDLDWMCSNQFVSKFITVVEAPSIS